MRLPRLALQTFATLAASLALTVSLASAAHVPQALPLTVNPDHSHEAFAPQAFPPGNYSGYDFSFADLSNCTFAPGTNLSFANFTGARMVNTNLSGCILDNANFSGADLSNSVLACMGGADFRGAILNGVSGGGTACAACGLLGPNRFDNCTTVPLPVLCFTNAPFRGVVAGVVFTDVNLNGVLDFGEPGVPGAVLTISAGGPLVQAVSSSRGGYSAAFPIQGPGTVGVTLPAGVVLAGPASLGFNLVGCRSAQSLNFPAANTPVPAHKSTFGRVKALYR